MQSVTFVLLSVGQLYCRVLKLADMPSCLGGGEFKINVV